MQITYLFEKLRALAYENITTPMHHSSFLLIIILKSPRRTKDALETTKHTRDLELNTLRLECGYLVMSRVESFKSPNRYKKTSNNSNY